MKEYEIWLVRHAKTWENANYVMIGHTDPPLSKEGIEDARQLAIRLRDQSVSQLFTSPLKRAHLTAEQLASLHRPPLSIEVSPLLRELDLGDMDGVSSFTAYEKWRGIMDQALDQTLDDFAFPNGEWRSEAIRRWELFLTQSILECDPKSPVWVVSHGAVIGLWLAKIYGMPLGAFRRFQPYHGSLTKIRVTYEQGIIGNVNMLKSIDLM